MVGKVQVSAFVFVGVFLVSAFIIATSSSFSISSSPTPAPTLSPTKFPSPPSPDPTPTPASTPTLTPSDNPTDTPTTTPTSTPTQTPTSSPTSTPTPTSAPTDAPTAAPSPTPNPNNTFPTFSPNSSVTPYIIVNTGPTVWQIIENNQPYENVTAFADALPKGVSDSSQLEFWVNTTFVAGELLYTVVGKNGNAVDFRWILQFTWGGDYHGIGMYLDEVTIIPTRADCFPFFNLQANAHILSPLNVGNQVNPVAGMQVDLDWTIEGPFEHKEGTSSYFIQGDGNWKCISECGASFSYDPNAEEDPSIISV